MGGPLQCLPRGPHRNSLLRPEAPPTAPGVGQEPHLPWHLCSAPSQLEPRWPGAPGTSSWASTAQGDTLVPAPGLATPRPVPVLPSPGPLT